ncbi:hypothetical protein LCGC14_1156870 [marine sediment metagenome]|uniref:Uncharacterized protein n=1 Tax=marine sediment metagenome TaxID=412755 RepID=A0A0F9PC18_9ZZZZ
MEHYLVTFRNRKIGDMKIVANNPKEAKDNAATLAKFAYKNTHVMVNAIWLCTKVS